MLRETPGCLNRFAAEGATQAWGRTVVKVLLSGAGRRVKGVAATIAVQCAGSPQSVERLVVANDLDTLPRPILWRILRGTVVRPACPTGREHLPQHLPRCLQLRRPRASVTRPWRSISQGRVPRRSLREAARRLASLGAAWFVSAAAAARALWSPRRRRLHGVRGAAPWRGQPPITGSLV